MFIDSLPSQNLVLQFAELMLQAGELWWDGLNYGWIPETNKGYSYFFISQYLKLCGLKS